MDRDLQGDLLPQVSLPSTQRIGKMLRREASLRVQIGLLIEILILFAIGAYSVGDGIRLVVGGKLRLYDVLGPGWYNIGMGSILLLAGAAYFLREVRAQKTKVMISPENRNRAIYMIASLFGYAALIEIVGYLAASFVFFAVIPKIAGIKSWSRSILIGIIMTVSFYFVFARWLDVIFPRGLWINMG